MTMKTIKTFIVDDRYAMWSGLQIPTNRVH